MLVHAHPIWSGRNYQEALCMHMIICQFDAMSALVHLHLSRITKVLWNMLKAVETHLRRQFRAICASYKECCFKGI